MSSVAGWIALGLAAATVVSSCGTQHGQPPPSRPTDQPVLTGEPAGDNAADVAFAQNVVALDRQAVDVASLARTHSGSSAVAAFAATTASARKSEIQVVNVFLVQWNTDPDGRRSSQPTTLAPGSLSQTTITELQAAHGGAFDKLWVPSMTRLENGVLDAAKAEVAKGENVDAIDMARQITVSRPGEIDQLSTLT